MNWIIENWYLVLCFIALGIVVGFKTKQWLAQPTNEQIQSIKNWLLYAVTEAESALGEKTGQLKLHMVYDMAIAKFEWLSFISFETFSGWVDEALVEMKEMLKNEHIKAFVKEKKGI